MVTSTDSPANSLAPAPESDSLPGMPREIILDVPILRQMNWTSCGLASVNMAMRYHGLVVTERALEKHPLVQERFLRRFFGKPGNLKNYPAGANNSGVVVNRAFAPSHPCFGGFFGNWLVRKNPD